MFRSVLAAAAFRQYPDPAVLSGIRLASLTGAQLHVVHASSDGGPSAGEQSEQLPSGSALSVHPGEPHEVIAACAIEMSADVIVLGPRTERSPIRGLLGTTAERVIRASRIPCLLSNAVLTEKPGSILLALDRSIPAREALRVGTAMTRELVGKGVEVSVHLLNISAFAQPGMRWPPGWLNLEKVARKVQSAVGAAKVSHGIVSAPLPVQGILEWVRSSSPDLLIMGTHSLGTLGRLLMGSVAQGVAREVTIPLLLVPPPADDRYRLTRD